ncbi:MAG: hypothetical protein A2939_00860 [Parcubacteria group bacterium RIFCSPLOWO2_01_FULL_48_18]|nr:MAG: hypothetical protein A3J67_04500 [Parcubacteria group bacterium RIFCSPHIGHO2_02_FULL_48_10b]OHB22026.1 MAG: hypothetical protein A2939_00860 [Parcubacteria group bacterium RIFCSPLOWO2_01_FULL_48_18]
MEPVSTESLLRIVFNPRLLFPVAGTVFIFFGVVSIILLHHWKAYSVQPHKIRRIIIIYFGVAGLLMLGILGTATVIVK